jgi:DNA processing protein
MNPRALTKSEVEALFGDYPYRPSSLYVIGSTSWGVPIAVVGTRKPSREAVSLTRRLVRELVGNGFTIITGGAVGIDAIATQEALGLGQKPVVVRPCLDDDARYWASRGAVVVMESVECPVGDRYRSALALRNRVIAGLARVIIIPEARAWRVGGGDDKPCCGTWYTAVKFRAGRRVFILKPLVSDVDVHEAFRVFAQNGAVPVGSIDELLARLRGLSSGLFGGWFS